MRLHQAEISRLICVLLKYELSGSATQTPPCNLQPAGGEGGGGGGKAATPPAGSAVPAKKQKT